jgi:hypothetical protein
MKMRTYIGFLRNRLFFGSMASINDVPDTKTTISTT